MTSREFVCGATGSGKSQYVRNHVLRHRRRIIVVDPIGDYPTGGERKWFSVRDALVAIRAHIYQGRTSWQVVVSLGRGEISSLVESLVPARDAYSSWVKLIGGGVTIVLEECDVLTPRGQHGEQIASLFRRGRHVGLSAVAVTQRPANVSKEVVAQADRVVAYRLDDPADLDYIRQRCGAPAVDAAREAWRTPHAAMLWERGVVSILRPDYQKVEWRAPDKDGWAGDLLDPP